MSFSRSAAALVLLLTAGCSRGSASSANDETPTVKAGPAAGTESRDDVVLDFLEAGSSCSFGHRGTLIDLGDVTTRARVTTGRLQNPKVETRERDGASWAVARERVLEITFVAPEESPIDAGVVVEARIRGGAAKSASVYLNGKPLGTLSVSKGETQVVALRAPSAVIARGANALTLHWNGGGKAAAHDDLAEVDWIRVGPIDGDAPYSAPTRNDAISTVSIGGVGKRSVSLRAPGFARCGAFVPNDAVLEAEVGVTGGEAEIEVRVLVDRAGPRVLSTLRIPPEEKPTWHPLSVPLGEIGTLANVEIAAKASGKGARVLFAEPKVVVKTRSPDVAVPASRGVVLVVLGGAPPRALPVYGGALAMPELSGLAASGAVFEAHRASTSFGSGAMASMLTGLAAREHGVESPEAALGPNGLTIAEAARHAGIVTAMFTANPTTSAPFGFARGWETFVARMPGEEQAATAIFEEAATWLDGHKDGRFLLVLHARGGHPPWDVSSDEVKDLAPANYAGALDPKHAGEMLMKSRRSSAMRFFTDADRERAFALHGKALTEHDTALGALIGHVKALGRDADTTWIVTGDVGIDAAEHVPFLEDDSLDEASLTLPLVIRAPGIAPGVRVSDPSSSVDIGRTVLEALGLPPPQTMHGTSLRTLARHPGAGEVRPLMATTSGRFSARWGTFVLAGPLGRDGKLCNLALDADCLTDVAATHGLAASLMHDRVVRELGLLAVPSSRSKEPPEPKNGLGVLADKPMPTKAPPVPNAVRADVTDPQIANALRAWGR